MRFSEILNRLTGISCPIFGMSWNPAETQRAIARRIIIYLEARRVLYAEFGDEAVCHCIDSVIEIKKFLTDELPNIDEGSELNSYVRAMRTATNKFLIQEADTAIENLWKALEHGQAAEMITQRIEKRQKEKDELQAQLAVEMGKEITFTTPQIKAFLDSLKRGNINDESTRLGLVNIFVRAIYLYDDRMTLILNGGDRPITIGDILLDEIAGHFEEAISGHSPCSSLVADAPPARSR